jgi:hypothetical protein
MGSGVTPPLSPPETVQAVQRFNRSRFKVFNSGSGVELLNLELLNDVLSQLNTGATGFTRWSISKYGQAARPISTGKLQSLLIFHIRPINLLV